jgi:tetratricopeptide (TPR) repeat protein
MNTADNQKGESESKTITPASIKLTRGQEQDTTQTVATNKAKLSWIIPLVVLIVIAIGVIFILPGHVTLPSLDPGDSTSSEATNSGNGQPASVSVNTSRPPEISPFQQAQEARLRNRSQELLSDLLKLQEELEDKNVLVWGAEQYQSIIATATEGDAAYRVRDFQQASDLYAEALQGMQSLLAEMDDIFNDALTKGQQALQQGLSSSARERFEYALQIKPDSEEAQAGLERSQTLDEVLALITEGNDLQLNSQLEASLEKYRAALNIDPQIETARDQIKIVNQKINDRNFNRLMSQGYQHLQEGNLEKARASFQSAGRLKPSSAEVSAAINQTQTTITNEKINDLIAAAVQLERQEKWAEAAAEYDKALTLDSNLAQVQEGKAYSSNRAALHQRLEQIIAEPHRLSNKAVFEETRLFIQKASTIPNPEPILSRQLNIISNLLNTALTPVQITFRSDNETNVTLFQLGTLGNFEERTLTLTPGDYVAVGTREGYRDVRVEFKVLPDTPAGTVIPVSATEKIASK